MKTLREQTKELREATGINHKQICEIIKLGKEGTIGDWEKARRLANRILNYDWELCWCQTVFMDGSPFLSKGIGSNRIRLYLDWDKFIIYKLHKATQIPHPKISVLFNLAKQIKESLIKRKTPKTELLEKYREITSANGLSGPFIYSSIKNEVYLFFKGEKYLVV